MNTFSNDSNAFEKNRLNEHQANYEKAEVDLLKDALKRTYKERLLFANRLYKIQQVFNRAALTHKPYSFDK